MHFLIYKRNHIYVREAFPRIRGTFPHKRETFSHIGGTFPRTADLFLIRFFPLQISVEMRKISLYFFSMQGVANLFYNFHKFKIDSVYLSL
jgi:hypothetical protein